MDQGIWATWYDIDGADSPRWLAWAHEVYLPYLRVLPGYTWVAHYGLRGGGPQMQQVHATVVNHTRDAIGGGTQFLVLVGAPTAHAFFKPALNEVEFPPDFAEMLALRRGLRTAVFTEEARVDGPARAAWPDAAPAPAIQMGSLQVRSIDEEFELGRWYAQYRLPSMAAMPGVVRTRKLTGVAGWPRHGILYEFESLEMRLAHFEQTHESLALDPEHWTARITRSTTHAPGSPFVGERLPPPGPPSHPNASTSFSASSISAPNLGNLPRG